MNLISKITVQSICTALLCSSPLSYGASDSLLHIYELAQANDHQLKSEYAQYLAGIETANINRAALRPQVTGSASLSDTNADTSGTTPSETDTDAHSYTVRLSQSLINQNAWNTYEQGKVQAEIAKLTYDSNQQSLMIRVSEAYFNALRAVDQQQTALSEEKAQATLLEQTQQRFDVGLISINDVHEAQAAYDSAIANRISTDANVGIRFDALTILTGQSHNDVASLKKDFEATTPSPNNQQEWVDFALQNNLSLTIKDLETQAARYAAKAAKGSRLPTLTGSVSYTDNNQDRDTVGAGSTRTDTNTTAFSLDLSVPLYTGGRNSAAHKQASQTAISAHESFLFTQRNTIQSIRSLFLSVTTDIAQIKARKQAIISNTSALESSKTGYEYGTRDIVDVVNAQRNLYQAQRDYLDTLYDYIINTLKLKETAGTLQKSDLEALEKALDI